MIGTEPTTWKTLDTWWTAFVETEPGFLIPETTREIDSRSLTDEWSTVDPWWEVFVESFSPTQVNETSLTLDTRLLDRTWCDLDPWWESFSEVREADVAKLKDVIEQSNQDWAQSESRFNTDPLTTDWTAQPDTQGPLRPNQEENWSQWLAHLLREAPAEFLNELFDVGLEAQPSIVEREVYFPDPTDSDRYADILLSSGKQGISIEVKRNDEHYWKTLHTAELIEEQRTGDWHHRLLLPKYKYAALRQTFSDDLTNSDEEQVVISSEESPVVTVMFWQEISAALRRVLKHGETNDTHWDASAYLFCTLIEQKILQLIPLPAVEIISTSNDVMHASQTLSIATGGVDEQIAYLEQTMGDKNE